MAGDPISVAIDPATHSLGDLVPPGTLLAAPFRTSSKQGAVLVYPRREGPFSAEEKSLLPVITSFASVAISNAELYAKARPLRPTNSTRFSASRQNWDRAPTSTSSCRNSSTAPATF
jgi:hypothetical protein